MRKGFGHTKLLSTQFYRPGGDCSPYAVTEEPKAERVQAEVTELDPTLLEEPQDWYFTFGVDHPPYTMRYVVVHGTKRSTREEMNRRFNFRWANQYPSYEDANIEGRRLKELTD